MLGQQYGYALAQTGIRQQFVHQSLRFLVGLMAFP